MEAFFRINIISFNLNEAFSYASELKSQLIKDISIRFKLDD